MSDPAPAPAATGDPPDSAITIANVVYALHSLAILVGVAGTATVIGSFIGSVPSIVAVVLNYAKRSEARGTWVESHYRWQIRTFWFALLWAVISLLLFATLIAIPISVAVLIATTLWVLYRIARGWLRLRERQPMYV